RPRGQLRRRRRIRRLAADAARTARPLRSPGPSPPPGATARAARPSRRRPGRRAPASTSRSTKKPPTAPRSQRHTTAAPATSHGVGVLFPAKSNGPPPGQVFWLASETLAYSGATAAAFDRLSLLAIRAAMHFW